MLTRRKKVEKRTAASAPSERPSGTKSLKAGKASTFLRLSSRNTRWKNKTFMSITKYTYTIGKLHVVYRHFLSWTSNGSIINDTKIPLESYQSTYCVELVMNMAIMLFSRCILAYIHCSPLGDWLVWGSGRRAGQFWGRWHHPSPGQDWGW